jgi:hypothetical protein
MRDLDEIRRRAELYLAAYPADEPAVSAITYSFHAGFGYQNAREVMELVVGGEIPEDTWTEYGPRWQRAWNSIAGGEASQIGSTAANYYG